MKLTLPASSPQQDEDRDVDENRSCVDGYDAPEPERVRGALEHLRDEADDVSE